MISSHEPVGHLTDGATIQLEQPGTAGTSATEGVNALLSQADVKAVDAVLSSSDVKATVTDSALAVKVLVLHISNFMKQLEIT